MEKDGHKMNAEEREYKERRSLSKLSPWYSEDKEEKTVPKTFSLPIEENEEND
jgi:hypothetical protein